MRKIIAILLLLTLLIPGAVAEGFDAPIDVAAEEAVSANISPLPVDLTGGYVPNKDCYIAADEENGILQGYEDESLTVTVERVKVGDSTFNVARIKIAHPSQLRTGLANEKGTKNNKISTMPRTTTLCWPSAATSLPTPRTATSCASTRSSARAPRACTTCCWWTTTAISTLSCVLTLRNSRPC